jgi:hypothetical protein
MAGTAKKAKTEPESVKEKSKGRELGGKALKAALLALSLRHPEAKALRKVLIAYLEED